MTEGARFATVLAVSAMLVGTAVAIAVMQRRSDSAVSDGEPASAVFPGNPPSPEETVPVSEAESRNPDHGLAVAEQRPLIESGSRDPGIDRLNSPAERRERSLDLDDAADIETEPTPQAMGALRQAIVDGNFQMLTEAIAAGASVRALEAAGTSPLILALESRRGGPILHTLVQLGADVSARNEGLETPLMWAARLGDGNGLYEMLLHGAEIDAVDSSGQTALFEAVIGGNVEAASTLLQWRADVNARDNSGRSPLSYANEEGNQAVIDLLRRSGGLEYLPPPIP